MTDRVGEVLGKYRLVRFLGRGSFAEVYLGEHVYLKAESAVKVLRTQLADSDVEGFLKEAQTIAHLVHPHIIRIFDFDVHEGTPFLVMDYAPHGTLRQRHPKGIPIPLRTAVYYVRQVADALQYAHNQKFIHRDVKPENMLLGRRDEVLLSDFGIVQVVISTLSENEGTQKIEGTIAYMAPEQFRGKARYATDQYALGVIVYEWLSGNRPFQGSLSEMASQHMFVPPPPLREKVPAISPAVEEVVMMALAKDPKERFANVQAFANAFEQAASVTPTSPHPVISPYAPPAPMMFSAPSIPASVNESAQVQQQIPPPQPTVIASSGDRPWLVQQQPPTNSTSSASSGAGMPVFTDPPAQIPVQFPTGVQPEPSGFRTTGVSHSPLQQPFKNKVGRNVLLISLAILLIASTLTAVILLRMSSSVPPGNGIGVSKAADGEYFGISDGTFAFDTNRPDGTLKQQAADKLKAHDVNGAIKLLRQAVQLDTNDAEALIYLEDLRVIASGHPYITLVVGTLLTTDFIIDGRNNLQGAYVSQKEFNSDSKLPGGVQVRLLIASSGNRTEPTTEAVAHQIVQATQADKTIVGVMGWPFADSSAFAISILATAHIPMVSPTAREDALTRISSYFFRVIASNKQQAFMGVQYAERTLHAKRVALFVDPADSYSNEFGTDFEQQFAASGNNIVFREDYTAGQPQVLSQLLQDALNHNPDMIYFAGSANDAGTLLAELPTSGPFAHLQILGPDHLDGNYPGKASVNFGRIHFTDFINDNTWDSLNLANKKPAFFTDFQQDFDPLKLHTSMPYGYIRANGDTLLSYDAMLSLLSGSKLALAGGKKSFPSSNLQQALALLTGPQAIQGVSGQISFGRDGNPINKAFLILKISPEGFFQLESVLGSFLVGT